MPETAFYFTRITDLPYREAVHWKRFVETMDGAHPDGPSTRVTGGAPLPKKLGPNRVYYGNEFCQERIPSRTELEASCRAVCETGLPLTFVTPPVNDGGCAVLSDRLTLLETEMPGSEVVVNDWGVLRLVHEGFPTLVPVLGRLLNKFLRDPRVMARDDRPAPSIPPGGSSLGMSVYRRLLARYGVHRTELDNIYQGIDLDFEALSLLASLYVPFGYVTTGRICVLGNLHLPRDRKFATPNGRCPRPCLGVEVHLTERNRRSDREPSTFIQRGNTIFYQQSEALVHQGIAWAEDQRARLVYQPEIPF